MDTKIRPSDLAAQAAELHRTGKMPKLEDVLQAVAEARGKYADKIKAARNQGNQGHAGIEALGKE
jgi:hypothetical protein